MKAALVTLGFDPAKTKFRTPLTNMTSSTSSA
jgi:hypothetical protein